MKLNLIVGLGAVGALLTAAPAHAQFNLDLFSTGIQTPWYNAAPVAFADGVADTNWSIISAPVGIATPVSATTATANPVWLANSATSKWINDNGNGNLVSLAGSYTYRTSFVIPVGTDLNSVNIVLRTTQDNSFGLINVNGVNSGLSSANTFDTFSGNFLLNSGFQIGTNNLDFVINNFDGPQGARVEIVSATALSSVAAPEPATLSLLALGGLAIARRRRK